MFKQCDSESVLSIMVQRQTHKSIGSVISEQLNKSRVTLQQFKYKLVHLLKYIQLTLVFAFILVLVGVFHSTIIGFVFLLRKYILLYFDCTSSVV